MMGTIVLTMLLSWFGVVAGLTIFSHGGEETLVEDPASVANIPHRAPDEPQSGIGA